MTLNIACNIQTKQIVWVRNGVKVHSAPSYIWSALGRKNKL